MKDRPFGCWPILGLLLIGFPLAQATDFEQALRQAGWKVEKSDDGSLMLFPPAPAAAEPAHDSPPSPAKPDASPLEPAQIDRLRQAGWKVEKSDDGGLMLFPPRQNASRLRPCPGETTDATIDLPVDGWQEARNIAQAWLRRFGPADATVGRIRKVLKVYLVSIVGRRPPHRLHHQLAIRARDGAVILLE